MEKTTRPASGRRSAGVVILHHFAEGWRFLLLRAFRDWDFPKGEIEENEAPLAAARREVAEETGITDLRFPWGEAFRETAPYGRGKVARYYLGETDQVHLTLPISPELGRPEHHEYRWVDLREARSLLPKRLEPVFEWAVQRIAAP